MDGRAANAEAAMCDVARPAPPTPSLLSNISEATDGDGGKVNSRLAEAALQRRGNAEMQRLLEDAGRSYNDNGQKLWEKKYNFHSSKHMKRSYRVFARAKHDPFNKDPSWGKSIIHQIGVACAKKGLKTEELFSGVDVTGDGNLNRPELKRVVCSVVPTLSDEELVAVFDTIDADGSGEVNVKEFCDTLDTGMRIRPVAAPSPTRWRNPVHRITRFPPAKVDGWDHLEGACQHSRFDRLCETQQKDMMLRLGEKLASTPRRERPKDNFEKHKYFSGGGDSARFRREQWNKERQMTAPAATASLVDPGPFPRPGWMYEAGMRETHTAGGQISFRLPRPSSRPSTTASELLRTSVTAAEEAPEAFSLFRTPRTSLTEEFVKVRKLPLSAR